MSDSNEERFGAGERMPEASPRVTERCEHAARSSEHGTHSSATVTEFEQLAARWLGEPRQVTRGERVEQDDQARPGAAHIDWLAFTVRPPGPRIDQAAIDWVKQWLRSVFRLQADGWKPTGRGWNGYEHRANLMGPGGQELGLSAYGGESQRGSVYVSLNAHGCLGIQDWNAVRLWGETYGATIKRVDLAHDDFEGECINVAAAAAWWRSGAFNVGGRPPSARMIDDFGSGDGKTLYVGRRENGKLLRVYEKGRELGDRASPWVRAEVELHGTGRVIPWDVVTRPGCYFAGAYPALRDFSDQPERIRTLRRAAAIEYGAMEHWVRTAAGAALHVMCRVEQGDTGAVLAKVMRDAVPRRLIGYPRFVVDELGEGQP